MLRSVDVRRDQVEPSRQAGVDGTELCTERRSLDCAPAACRGTCANKVGSRRHTHLTHPSGAAFAPRHESRSSVQPLISDECGVALVDSAGYKHVVLGLIFLRRVHRPRPTRSRVRVLPGPVRSNEGMKAGEFYTPRSVVELLVEVLQPDNGRVLDPAYTSRPGALGDADWRRVARNPQLGACSNSAHTPAAINRAMRVEVRAGGTALPMMTESSVRVTAESNLKKSGKPESVRPRGASVSEEAKDARTFPGPCCRTRW